MESHAKDYTSCKTHSISSATELWRYLNSGDICQDNCVKETLQICKQTKAEIFGIDIDTGMQAVEVVVNYTYLMKETE